MKQIHPSGDVLLSICGRMLLFNPVCLAPAPGQATDEGGGGGDEATGMSKRKEMTLF